MVKNHKLKIAIVTNNYTPYSGGLVSSINSLVKELIKQNYQPFIITLDFLGKKHNDPEYVIRVPSIIRFMYKKNHMAVPWRLTNKLEKIIKEIKPDIIHTQHPFLIGVSALKIAKRLNIPIIFTYHTMYEHYAHYLPMPQFLTKPLIKKKVISFCRKVDSIIVPSDYIKNYLKKEKINTKLIKIPSGIDPIFIKSEILKKNGKTFKLLNVGRFAKEKNVTILLNIFAEFHQKSPKTGSQQKFTFTLAGYGPEYDYLQNYAHQLGLKPKNIKFVHKPDKSILSELYNKSDLFIFSSKSDTQGLVLAEAMGCGCPVVAMDGPGQRDIIKNNENGFLVMSKSQMIEKINLIAKNSNLHEKLKKGALKTGKNYHPQKTSNKMIKFYKKILSNNKSQYQPL